MEFPVTMIDLVAELHAAARSKTDKLRRDTEESETEERSWADCHKYLFKGWSLHFLDFVEREAPRLRQLRAENHHIVGPLEQAYRVAKDEAAQLIRRYPGIFEQACKAADLPLDSNSRHPKYSFESGFFRLEINEKKLSAVLSDYEGRLIDLPADVDAVTEAIDREHKRIFGRTFNGNKFLRTLRNQYKAIIKKENLPDGSSLPIRHITRRLGKNIKGFRTDEFLLDLSRLCEKGPFEIEGRRLDLQQTKDTSQGMLLHGAAARGYIGFVVFKEA